MRMHTRRALTIVELVLLLAILGVIIAILIPRFRHPVAAPARVVILSAPDSVIAPGSTADVGVMLTDSAGQPARNARVAFAITRGGGAVSPPAAMTDSAGHATVHWTIGPDTGRKELSVSAPDGAGATATVATVARPPAP
jgi:Bacterial Ig-like domain (group 1)